MHTHTIQHCSYWTVPLMLWRGNSFPVDHYINCCSMWTTQVEFRLIWKYNNSKGLSVQVHLVQSTYLRVHFSFLILSSEIAFCEVYRHEGLCPQCKSDRVVAQSLVLPDFLRISWWCCVPASHSHFNIPSSKLLQVLFHHCPFFHIKFPFSLCLFRSLQHSVQQLPGSCA